MDNSLFTKFSLCILGVVLIFTVIGIIRAIKGKKTQKTNNTRPTNKYDLLKQEFETIEIKATVTEQSCCAKLVGTKTPKAVKEFTITFKTDDGQLLKLSVPEEMYDGFEKGQYGLLTIIDGELYSFDLD